MLFRTDKSADSLPKMSRILVLVLSAFVMLTMAEDENPIVQAPIGKIRGSTVNSRLGRKIYSFRSVRFAEPPVGELRFQPPVPAADWSDIYDGTQEGPACTTISNTTISEDCLRLNVYTTKLPTQNTKGGHSKGRPVMVFFHPGGFYAFSGQSRYFGPEYIMDKDIVLVTVNNRMGSLGFISTGDSLAPGNNGLKDQVMALRWVQRNIAAFGGDPNSVTIFGYSAGSRSVLLHMLSPMSKGLFHRAIAMSATALQNRPYPREQKRYAIKQAELLDCPTDSTASILNCLRTRPIENFTATMNKFFEYRGDPIMLWSPVVEPEVPGKERFLTAPPEELIRLGKINAVPLIIGTTKDEFGGVVTGMDRRYQQGDNSSFDSLNKDWYTRAPISFLYERNTSRSRHISDELRQFYFNNQSIGPDSYEGIAHIYADSVVIFLTHRIAQLMAQHNPEPVYFYKFTYQGRFSFNTWSNSTPYGVVHHDDLQYLFYMQAIFPFLNATSPEVPMVERHTSMWTNFARTSEPIPKDQEIFKDVVWERFEKEKDNYFEINLNPTMKRGYFPERMQFWDSLFPLGPLPHTVECEA